MRKRHMIGIVLAAVLCLNACQKAPEVSSDEDILRAKDPQEDVIQSLAKEQGDAKDGSKAGEKIDLVLGEGENVMHIKALFPAVAEASGSLIMQADSSLNENKLKVFLEPQGAIRDTTQELIKNSETEKRRAIEAAREAGEENPESVVQTMPSIGDKDFKLQLTDGNRTVTCMDYFFLTYKDDALWEKYMNIIQKCEKEKTEESGIFSMQEAQQLLLKKLSLAGIAGVSFYEAHTYEADGLCFYEMMFTPSFDGIGVTSDFGSHKIDEIVPQGYAWVGMDGVGKIELSQFCMQAAALEEGRTFSFDRLKEILAVYLENGDISCNKAAAYSGLDFVYYPMTKQEKLYLVPSWNINIPLDVYVEDVAAKYPDVNRSIFIDAATGELLKVE